MLLSRIRFDDRRRIRLVFWVQRHRSSTLDRARRVARPRFCRDAAREAMRLVTKPQSALESVTKEASYTSLSRIRMDDRRRRFRLRKPSFWTAKICNARSQFIVVLGSFFQAPVPEPHFSTVFTCWIPIGRGLRKGVVWLRPEAALLFPVVRWVMDESSEAARNLKSKVTSPISHDPSLHPPGDGSRLERRE